VWVFVLSWTNHIINPQNNSSGLFGLFLTGKLTQITHFDTIGLFQCILPRIPAEQSELLMEEKTIGLLLQSFPYLSSHRILKVLTPKAGLLTFMARFGASKRAALTTPFLLADWIYAKDKKEIHTLTDASLVDNFSSLKQTYERVEAAGKLAQDLLRTQLPGKPTEAPFELAVACLRKIDIFSNPETLVAAFRLKLLVVEGLLNVSEPEVAFTPPEQVLFEQLANAKSFAQLAALAVDKALFQKIDRLFENFL